MGHKIMWITERLPGEESIVLLHYMCLHDILRGRVYDHVSVCRDGQGHVWLEIELFLSSDAYAAFQAAVRRR